MECQRTMEPKDIPCIIHSSWKPSGGCTGGLSIYSENGINVENISWTESVPFCNATFNITEEGTYIYNSSIEDGIIIVGSEDNMTSLGIIIFLLLLNFALFYIPYKFKLNKNKVVDHIMKYITWILGWTILAFNTTIFASLADNAGLGITHELFVFQWFFLKALYILMIALFFKMMLMVPKLLKEQRTERRTGQDER